MSVRHGHWGQAGLFGPLSLFRKQEAPAFAYPGLSRPQRQVHDGGVTQ
jgi:hypothetical protein